MEYKVGSKARFDHEEKFNQKLVYSTLYASSQTLYASINVHFLNELKVFLFIVVVL